MMTSQTVQELGALTNTHRHSHTNGHYAVAARVVN